ELRIALVLNGGVSLAIWISGVVAEIDALRRADDPAAGTGQVRGDGDSSCAVYRELCEALGVQVRVDVIAGTSAGGLNGGMLGTAIAAGLPFAGVRDLWLDIGDLKGLLRPEGDGDPELPSLLRGETVFYTQLEKRFMEALGSAAPEPPGESAEETGRRVRM